jgi:hypothetical protein
MEVDDTAPKAAFVHEFERQPYSVGKRARTGSDEKRNDEQVQLVDETGCERMRGERRTADRDIALG